MALVVEDGTGKTDAESYISEVDADTYFTAHGDSTDWSGATTAEKEEALRVGTQYLDLVYGQRWVGYKTAKANALGWPRYVSESNRTGYYWESDEVPIPLEQATCEAALRHITETDGFLPDITKPGTIVTTKSKVGPIVKETTYTSTGQSQIPTFRIITLMLADLIGPRHQLERA